MAWIFVGWRCNGWSRIDRRGRRPVPVYPMKTRERTESDSKRIWGNRGKGGSMIRAGHRSSWGRCSLCSPHAPAQWVGRMRDENNGGRVLNLWTDSIRPAPPSSLPSTFRQCILCRATLLPPHLSRRASVSCLAARRRISVRLSLSAHLSPPPSTLSYCAALFSELFSSVETKSWIDFTRSIARKVEKKGYREGIFLEMVILWKIIYILRVGSCWKSIFVKQRIPPFFGRIRWREAIS